jgi:hypothetical protein
LMAVRDMQEELRHFLSARTERNVVLWFNVDYS